MREQLARLDVRWIILLTLVHDLNATRRRNGCVLEIGRVGGLVRATISGAVIGIWERAELAVDVGDPDNLAQVSRRVVGAEVVALFER